MIYYKIIRSNVLTFREEVVERGEGWVSLLKLQGRVQCMNRDTKDYVFWGEVRVE